MELEKQVKERIRTIRTLKSIKQSEIAEKVNLSQGAYSNLESGETELSLNKLQKIAEALGVSMQYLLFGSEPTSQTEIEKDRKIKSYEKKIKELSKNLSSQKSEFISIINSVLNNYLEVVVSGFVSVKEGFVEKTLEKNLVELLRMNLPDDDKLFLMVQKIIKDFEKDQIKPEYENIITSLFFPFSSIDFDYYIKSGYIKNPAIINAYKYLKEKILPEIQRLT